MSDIQKIMQEFEQWKIEETNRIKKIYDDKFQEFQDDITRQMNSQKNGINSIQDQKEQKLATIINELQELSEEYDEQLAKKAQMEEEIKQNYGKLEIKPIQVDTNREARIGRISELRFKKEILLKENKQLKAELQDINKSIERYKRLYTTTSTIVNQALKDIKKNKASEN
ncbi:hypothetical protein TVAG_346730 [Trichomonas vaginalis G3]|uniref:Uncharacterized protein n=1 Tax=Trichomonas vaginalis (strain ATCC PRA-98 / G3) TaxID=412133 RepID=A2FBN4_TRIV3|nr:hypothetical protein TVAGG3_0938020 [Trichomonas vaginalis G3]EAX97671.1 hypothetical protein TVAG_346730 [Trichomonas vaginalis G3]KAI5486332.1 hypothetical protein TVAGG3_0938020 [Trichomonas vaginalis G3]|eukprot:XP_001310601.1 hypothetical protein [Trichomonas vaginalis G3]